MNPSGGLVIPLPLSGMSVKFNPHRPSLVGVGCAENFGIVGGGLCRIMDSGTVVSEVPMPNAVFSVAWSEADENLLVAACGDGFLRVCTAGNNAPVSQAKIHVKEIIHVENSHNDPVSSSSFIGFVLIFPLIEVLCHFLD